ncbi:unnamed protein product [Haemonchus placei]|uniref:Secreted protein n=1 Tax=Haemonchus placei TaxID=6290 RepID=A0A0N4VSZ7_HAEPC|nr:unnamed protein product [Haemonchus placei]
MRPAPDNFGLRFRSSSSWRSRSSSCCRNRRWRCSRSNRCCLRRFRFRTFRIVVGVGRRFATRSCIRSIRDCVCFANACRRANA